MRASQLSRRQLIRMMLLRVLVFVPAMFLLFFLPAGTFAYWEAWLYLAILLIPMMFVFSYLIKNDPELLERRMRMREKVSEQKLIIKFSYLVFLVIFLLPGFDRRWEWSQVPVAVVLAAGLVVLFGYGIFFLVMRENRYASRIIEVEQEQTVISTGPYAIVRHPMYLGALLMYLASPLALGSYWALIPALLTIPILVARILNEEKVLARELTGYREYMQTTRFHLIPGIW
jgi:protein-S-isoprenylcysteine O-methyltransferase Ste14